MLTAAALVLMDGQSDALIAIIAGISFRSRHNRSAVRHQQDTPCPHPRCPSTLHHKRTPELTGIFTAIRLKRLCRIQFILVLFRRCHRARQNLQRCQSSLLALFLSRASRPHTASNTGPDTDFEDIPLTEPDDDIRPEPDGDGGGNLPSDEELEAMFGEDDEIEADAVFDAGA